MDEIILQRNKQIIIHRDEAGTPHIYAQTEEDLYFGQGFMQASDRSMQIFLTRLVGQGRVSEFISSTDEFLELDKYFRRMNWRGDASRVIADIPDDVMKLGQAFVDGINYALESFVPWEFRWLGYYPEPYRLEDAILLFRMIGYLGLQETQGEAERFFLEMLKGGVPRSHLEEMFGELIDEYDDEIFKDIRPGNRITPSNFRFLMQLAVPLASNNWAVSGKKTESGSPIMAADPHMNTARLPGVWQEMALKLKDRYIMGVSMPGLPGIMMGRNNDLSWSATYSFMDQLDSWVEDCREGKYRRGSKIKTQWARFRERWEVIKRKGKNSVNITYFENEHGVLDGNPFEPGYYLATRWAGADGTGPRSLETMFKMLHATNVKTGMDLLGRLETTYNWVLADREDNIGYQMSGLYPKRNSDSHHFIPRPGWEMKYDWKGFVQQKYLPRRYNPREGFIATANNDLNEWGQTSPINLPNAPYRVERISHVLKSGKNFTISQMADLQHDTYSIQAEKFMKLILPLLPETEHGKILSQWDYCYEVNSTGAYLFEKFYHELVDEVFGDGGLGRETIRKLRNSSMLFLVYYSHFDRIMLMKKSVWFGGRTRDEVYLKVLKKVLVGPVRKWGAENRFVMRNLMLSGKLPGFLQVDRGPYLMAGGRACVFQVQAHMSMGQKAMLAPSYRMITDMSEDRIHRNIPGGPVDRAFSKLYNLETNGWLKKIYKILEI